MRLNKLQFMYILGDIGNSETKIFLTYPNGKVFKRINFLSKDINNKILNIRFKKIEKYFNKRFKPYVIGKIINDNKKVKLNGKVSWS